MAVYFATLTLLAALATTNLVSSAPLDLDRQEELRKEAATLDNLVKKLTDLTGLLQRVKQHLVDQKDENVANEVKYQDQIMSLLRMNQGEQAEIHEVGEKTDKNEQEQAIILAMELEYLEHLFTEVQERLITATEQFCWNPDGICCTDQCG